MLKRKNIYLRSLYLKQLVFVNERNKYEYIFCMKMRKVTSQPDLLLPSPPPIINIYIYIMCVASDEGKDWPTESSISMEKSCKKPRLLGQPTPPTYVLFHHSHLYIYVCVQTLIFLP